MQTVTAITKHCSRCKVDKPILAFCKNRAAKDGRNDKCRPCANIVRKEYYAKQPHKRKNKNLKHDYGITLDQYNIMFNEQNGKCSICSRHQQEFKRALAVDHSHITSKIRGLLCIYCNVGIGRFNDSIELLKKAIAYLESKGE